VIKCQDKSEADEIIALAVSRSADVEAGVQPILDEIEKGSR
jgi:hypothetical protein